MSFKSCFRTGNISHKQLIRTFSEAKSKAETTVNDDEFRVLVLYPSKRTERKSSKSFFTPPVLPAREKSMPIDQDWPSVWPTAKSFRPSVVPLPVYQGYDQKKAPPGKFANAELMKIPNFLHLTPPAIERQCAAIKKFCTAWPAGLDTDEKCLKHFPLEVTTTDYCHSSPSIRDERSRIVTIKIKMPSLNMDYHACDKFARLVGEDRFDRKTGIITIVADRCPLRKQNYDYLMYLLTALYHESKIIEPWEAEKTEADMEKFFFENSRHEKHIIDTLSSIMTSTGSEVQSFDSMKSMESVKEYGDHLTALINEGESDYTMSQYKNTILKILNLSKCDIVVEGETVQTKD